MYYSRNGCRGLTASLCGVVGMDRSTRCDPGGACGLVLAGEEVVGALEGDEAAGMPRGREYVAGVRDAHGVIGRRMHQQQGAANSLDRSRRSAARTSSMKCRLRVSALPPNEERHFTVSVDSVEKSVVVVLHVRGLERCCDAERRRHRRALVGRGYGGGPLERMSAEKSNLAPGVVHELHSPDCVVDRARTTHHPSHPGTGPNRGCRPATWSPVRQMGMGMGMGMVSVFGHERLPRPRCCAKSAAAAIAARRSHRVAGGSIDADSAASRRNAVSVARVISAGTPKSARYVAVECISCARRSAWVRLPVRKR